MKTKKKTNNIEAKEKEMLGDLLQNIQEYIVTLEALQEYRKSFLKDIKKKRVIKRKSKK